MSFICSALYTRAVQRDQDGTDSSDLCLPGAVIGEFRQKIISHYSLLSFCKTAPGKKSEKATRWHGRSAADKRRTIRGGKTAHHNFTWPRAAGEDEWSVMIAV